MKCPYCQKICKGKRGLSIHITYKNKSEYHRRVREALFLGNQSSVVRVIDLKKIPHLIGIQLNGFPPY